MMMRISLLLVFLLLNLGVKAQFGPVNTKLSTKSKVSLLFIEEGQEQLFQVFGHVCIMVKDDSLGIDRVFSYGAFDYDTKGFYWKFITGQLPYRMAETNLYTTMIEYGPQYENRSVTEQELDLNLSQKQRVYDLLIDNIRPENSTYQYKFFHDNCSTRIRDILEKALGNELEWVDKKPKNWSYREHMNYKLFNKQGIGFLMNLAIGAPADEKCDTRKAMYLPQNFQGFSANSKLGNKPLVKNEEILYKSDRDYSKIVKSERNRLFIGIVFWILLAVRIISYILEYLKINVKYFYWIDKIFIWLMIGFGAIIIFLWFFTSHGVTEYNYHLILPISYFTIRKILPTIHNNVWIQQYLKFNVSILYLIGIVICFILVFTLEHFKLSSNVFSQFYLLTIFTGLVFYCQILNQKQNESV